MSLCLNKDDTTIENLLQKGGHAVLKLDITVFFIFFQVKGAVFQSLKILRSPVPCDLVKGLFSY